MEMLPHARKYFWRQPPEYTRLSRSCLSVLLAVFSSGLPADERRETSVDQLFSEYRRPDAPGCSLGVISNGAFIYRRSYGAASLELGVPLSDQSVFYLASVSKQFTAASVVLAAEQGFLSLDDSVRKHIPELPPYAQSATLRQMLHHASGFRDLWGLIELSGRRIADEHPKKELLDLIARQQALNFAPGAEYQYSNTNYFLLAEALERATRKSLAEFAEANIFRPLGMVHSHFHDDHSRVVEGRVSAYTPTPAGKFAVNWSTSFDNVGPGGVMSTMDDLFRWDQNFYGNRLGSGSLMRELFAPAALNNGQQIGAVLGGTDTYRGLRIVEQAGALFGYRADILRFPEQRFTVICLCNTSGADPVGLTRKVADIYLAREFSALPKPQAVRATRRLVSGRPFVGRYLDPRDHTVISFDTDARGLVWRGGALRSISSAKFESPSGRVFSFKEAGGEVEVTATSNGTPWFVGKRIPEFHPDDATIRFFSGTYSSAELDAIFRLLVANDRLTLYRGTAAAQELAPFTEDEFENPIIGKIKFHRDADGRVTSFSVYGDGVRNLTFIRERQ